MYAPSAKGSRSSKILNQTYRTNQADLPGFNHSCRFQLGSCPDMHLKRSINFAARLPGTCQAHEAGFANYCQSAHQKLFTYAPLDFSFQIRLAPKGGCSPWAPPRLPAQVPRPQCPTVVVTSLPKWGSLGLDLKLVLPLGFLLSCGCIPRFPLTI